MNWYWNLLGVKNKWSRIIISILIISFFLLCIVGLVHDNMWGKYTHDLGLEVSAFFIISLIGFSLIVKIIMSYIYLRKKYSGNVFGYISNRYFDLIGVESIGLRAIIIMIILIILIYYFLYWYYGFGNPFTNFLR